MLILQGTRVLLAGLRRAFQKQTKYIYQDSQSPQQILLPLQRIFFSFYTKISSTLSLSLKNELIKIERHHGFQFWDYLLKQRTKSEVKLKQEHVVFRI